MSSRSMRKRNKRSGKAQPTVNQVALTKLNHSFGQIPLQQYVQSKIIVRTANILTTSGIGLITSTIPMDPGAAVGWGEVQTYYDEFRVIGSKLQIYCMAPNSVTRICDLVIVVYDNDDASALVSTASAYAYADKLIFPSIFINHQNGIQFAGTRPATSSSPIPWVDVQTPSQSTGGFKFFSETLDTGVNALRVYIEWYVEVRGRRG